MSAAQQVARAAFRLARITDEAQRKGRDITDADVDRLVLDLGAESVSVALRVQAEMMLEEAALLESYGAVKAARDPSWRGRNDA